MAAQGLYVAIIDLIIKANLEQLQAIYQERQRLNENFGPLCDLARKAASYLHKETWSLHCITYVNAVLLAINRAKLNDPYITMVLLSTTEGFSFAQTGMLGLTYEQYNIVIAPIASVLAPEMFQKEQSWQLEFVSNAIYKTPYYPPGYEPKARKRRSIELDSYGELDEFGLTSRELARVIEVMATEPGQQSSEPASVATPIQRMMEKLGRASNVSTGDPVQRMIARLKKDARQVR